MYSDQHSSALTDTPSQVCRAGFQYHTRRFIVQVRGSLVPLLYRHMLRADPMKTPQSVPVSLVSVDMEKIALGLITIHDIWGSLIEIGLFIWMIERQIHLAVLASALASLGMRLSGVYSCMNMLTSFPRMPVLWLFYLNTSYGSSQSLVGGYPKTDSHHGECTYPIQVRCIGRIHGRCHVPYISPSQDRNSDLERISNHGGWCAHDGYVLPQLKKQTITS